MSQGPAHRLRIKRAEMHIPGLAIKHELARQDQELAERCGVAADGPRERRNQQRSEYQELAGTKGMARMADADHKYKTGVHQMRIWGRGK